jgi:molybdopterin converting factor small subunit
MIINLILFASAKQAAGIAEKTFDISSIDDLRNQLTNLGGAKLVRIIEVSSVLSQGEKINIFDFNQLKNGQTLEILPPFAGG